MQVFVALKKTPKESYIEDGFEVVGVFKYRSAAIDTLFDLGYDYMYGGFFYNGRRDCKDYSRCWIEEHSLIEDHTILEGQQ